MRGQKFCFNAIAYSTIIYICVYANKYQKIWSNKRVARAFKIRIYNLYVNEI
jgi:hypothetical protein